MKNINYKAIRCVVFRRCLITSCRLYSKRFSAYILTLLLGGTVLSPFKETG